jgi:hypothetical protein
MRSIGLHPIGFIIAEVDMFTTYVRTIETITRGVAEDGGMNWHWAKRKEHGVWFHACAYEHAANDGSKYVVLMFDSIYVLEAVLESGEYKVLSIQLVLPGHLSGKEGWSMEPLSELRYTLDSDGMPIAICRMRNGEIYSYSASAAYDTPDGAAGSKAAMDDAGVFQWYPVARVQQTS